MHCNLDIVPERTPDGAHAASLGRRCSGRRTDPTFAPRPADSLNLDRSAQARALFAATSRSDAHHTLGRLRSPNGPHNRDPKEMYRARKDKYDHHCRGHWPNRRLHHKRIHSTNHITDQCHKELQLASMQSNTFDFIVFRIAVRTILQMHRRCQK